MSAIISTTNIDGGITLTEEAKIPVMDRGFLYGDSVYEVFRTYDGVPFLYDEHWARLQNSASLIHMDIGISYDSMRKEIDRTLEASGANQTKQDVYVRYCITRGEGPVDLSPSEGTPTRFVITVKALPQWNPDFYSTGMHVAIPAVRRNPSDALNPNIKGGNYLNNVLGVLQAKELGADDCIFLNHEHEFTEASNSNFFLVIDGEAVTPSGESGLLNGLTKQIVKKVCEANDLGYEERVIKAGEVTNATECFVTSSTREVMPVKSIRLESEDTIEFPDGGGEMTRKIMRLYTDFTRDYVKAN